LTQTFSSPVGYSESVDDAHHVYFTGPLVSFNLMHVTHELAKTPANAKQIYLHVTDQVTLVDHTSCESLLHFADDCHRNGTASVKVLGLDAMAPRSEFPSCMRTRFWQLACRASANGHPRKAPTRALQSGGGVNTQQVDPDNGMAFLSLSEPVHTSDGRLPAASDHQPHGRASLGWLDLEPDSEKSTAPRDRQAQARADMDWLSLERTEQ